MPLVMLLPMLVNCVLNAAVIDGTAATRHTAKNAAMSPYSIAVTPDSFFTKREINLLILNSSKMPTACSPVTLVR